MSRVLVVRPSQIRCGDVVNFQYRNYYVQRVDKQGSDVFIVTQHGVSMKLRHYDMVTLLRRAD